MAILSIQSTISVPVTESTALVPTATPQNHKIQHHVNRRQLPAATPTAPLKNGKCQQGGILCSGVCYDPGVYAGCASGVPVKLLKRTMKNAQCYASKPTPGREHACCCPFAYLPEIAGVAQELCPIRANSPLSECVFTQIDIESCGGCLYPNMKELARSGRNFTLGQDCTAIVSPQHGRGLTQTKSPSAELANISLRCTSVLLERHHRLLILPPPITDNLAVRLLHCLLIFGFSRPSSHIIDCRTICFFVSTFGRHQRIFASRMLVRTSFSFASTDPPLQPNIAEVACIRGLCVVQSCIQGFTVNADSSACIPQSGTVEDPKLRYRLT